MKVILRYGDDGSGMVYDSNRDFERAVKVFGERSCVKLHEMYPNGDLYGVITSLRAMGFRYVFLVCPGCLLDYIGYKLDRDRVVMMVDEIYYYRFDNDNRDLYGYMCGMRVFGNADIIGDCEILDMAPASMMDHDQIWSRKCSTGEWTVVKEVTTFYKNYYKKNSKIRF